MNNKFENTTIEERKHLYRADPMSLIDPFIKDVLENMKKENIQDAYLIFNDTLVKILQTDAVSSVYDRWAQQRWEHA